MKKVLAIILIICIFCNLSLISYGIQNIYGSTDEYIATLSKKHIKVKIVSVNKKQLKLNFMNKGNKDFLFGEKFVLKKRVKNKWKKVKFKENVGFRITMTAWKNSNTTVKVKWKRFFGKDLPKGRYKIKYVRAVTFRIK